MTEFSWWKYFHKYPESCWLFSIFWLIVISIIAFLWGLGSTGLVDETEPLFAEAARQMVVRNDWVTPYFNNETRFDKPILIYWLMAISYQLIGVNEWAVRLPSAFSAIALTIVIFFTLRYFGFTNSKIFNKKGDQTRQLWLAAWLGVAINTFNLQTILWARIGVSDMLLSACIGIGLCCFFWGYAYHYYWYFAAYIMFAFAVLSKGPVGIVLPALIIITFLIYVGKLKIVLQEMQIIKGGLLFLIITLPWYILITLKNGEAFINDFFGYHNLERFTSVVNKHSAPWYFYFIVVLVGFIPWSIYLPIGIGHLKFWQRKSWQMQPRQNQLGLFAFFWFMAIFIFFTIAITKLPSYVLPLIPAASIIIALFWSQELNNQKSGNKKGLFLSGIINVLLLLILAGVFLFSPQLIGKDPAVENVPLLISESRLPWYGTIIWGLTAVAIGVLVRKAHRRRWIIIVNLVGFLAFIILVFYPANTLMDNARQLPLRQLSAKVIQVQNPQEEILLIGFKKPSIAFYTQKHIYFFKSNKNAIDYAKDTINQGNLADTILIITRLKDITKLNLTPQDYQIIQQQGRYYLIRVLKQTIIDHQDNDV